MSADDQLIAAIKKAQGKPDETARAKFKALMVKHFSDEEIKDIAFDLSLDADNIPHINKDSLARELIVHCQRTYKADALRRACQRRQPQANFPKLENTP